MKEAFDNEMYLKVQKEKIEERIRYFGDKLYMEFGGKLFDDYHASRVLPGFHADAKIKLLQEFKEDLEVIICINAGDIEKNKIRADYGIRYDMELIRLIDNLQALDITVSNVVMTMFDGQEGAKKLRKILEEKGIRVYTHEVIPGYPNDVEKIVSEQGYGKNAYIKTTKKLVVVTAPGANSGKLATCLNQLYHENKRGVKAGYAKYETFPVWDLPLMHPVNVAYEAATADLGDINIIDPFHLEAYNIKAVNYNRDISTFPILKNILNRIMKEDVYQSPTDMGVNRIRECIIDDEQACKSASMEIIRRYFAALCEYKQEIGSEEIVERIETLMNELKLSIEDRKVRTRALEVEEQSKREVAAIELENGKIITGKESELLTATSAMFLNAVKEFAGIPDEVFLLSPSVLESIFKTKQRTSYKRKYQLNLTEVLIALSICSSTNPIIEETLNHLDRLRGLESHISYIIPREELNVLKNLEIYVSCEPKMIGD